MLLQLIRGKREIKQITEVAEFTRSRWLCSDFTPCASYDLTSVSSVEFVGWHSQSGLLTEATQPQICLFFSTEGSLRCYFRLMCVLVSVQTQNQHMKDTARCSVCLWSICFLPSLASLGIVSLSLLRYQLCQLMLICPCRSYQWPHRDTNIPTSNSIRQGWLEKAATFKWRVSLPFPTPHLSLKPPCRADLRPGTSSLCSFLLHLHPHLQSNTQLSSLISALNITRWPLSLAWGLSTAELTKPPHFSPSPSSNLPSPFLPLSFCLH